MQNELDKNIIKIGNLCYNIYKKLTLLAISYISFLFLCGHKNNNCTILILYYLLSYFYDKIAYKIN